MDRSVEELANSTTAFYKQMILLFDSTNNDWLLYKKRQKEKVFVRSFFLILQRVTHVRETRPT